MADPERIYLQRDDMPPYDTECGRTWSEDRISPNDTEYVRMDLFTTYAAHRPGCDSRYLGGGCTCGLSRLFKAE